MKTIKLIILLVVVLSLSAMAFHNVIPNPDGDFSGEFQTMNVGDDYFYFVPNKTGQAGFQVTNPRAGIGFAHDLKLYVQETSGWKLLAEKSSSSKDVAIVDVTLWAGKLYKLQYDEPYAYVDTATIIGHIPVEIVGYRVVDTLLDENGDKTYTGEWINPGADFDYYDYTAPESGTLNVDTLDSTLGFDTDLFVFKKNMSGNWYLYDSDSGDADNGGVSFLVSKGSRYVFVVGSSDLETGEYEITFNGPPLPKLSAPRISPDGGTHVGSCDISLSSYPSDSTIRYTIDDTDPTKSSTEYTGSFTISSSCTVKAKVFKAGYTASDSSSTYFTITPAPTRIISLSGDLDFPQTQVGLSVSVPGALKISNTGNSSLNITGISYPSGFSGENWKGTILDGGEKNITVTFSPAAARDYNGTITVNSDNRTGGENTITCTGLGLKGSASTVVITVPSSNPYSTGSSSMTFFGLAPSGSTRVGYVNSKTGRSDSDWDAVETDGTWGGRPISFDVGDNPITITAYNAQGGFTGSGSITVKRQNNIKTAPASRVACQDIRSDASKPHPEPYVGYCTDQYFGTERVLIKFNLPVLPNGSKVTGAVLGARTDWENYGTPFTIHAYRINDSWSQSVTWNSFVNGGSSNPYDKTSPVISNPENVPNAENVNVSWNVTDIYKDWSAGIEDNNGIILIAESNVDSGRQGYCDRSFDVSRFSLTVTYEAETTPPSITISSPVSDATYTTRNSTVDLSGTASDSQNFVASVTWKNQQTEKSGTCSGTESWSVSGIALNEGENLIIVTATDSVGNKTDTQIAVIYNHPQKILRLSGDLTFGSVVVGNTTTADLVICNDGDTPLTVTGISYPLGFSGDESGGEIPSGGSKTVSVSFVPDVVQEYSDTITVNSDKTSGNNMINCSGTGIKATRILRLGGDLDFGEIITNQHAFGELTIYNDGNSSLSVTNIDYPSGFSGNWTGVVEAVRSHSIPVLFEPVLVQDYSGTITVYSDPTSGSNTITCSGFGTQLPYPDLIITNVSYTAGTYQAGDVFTVTASEMNRSEDVDVTETFTNQAVLSTSKIWGDVSNILVYEGIENEGMDAGEEYSVTNSIPVPASIPAGSYYLGIMADVNDDVEESIETNNVWWSDSADIVVADGGGNPPDWQPPSGKPYSMIVYATVDLDGSPIESSGSSLAAFYGDGSVVGVTDVITGPSGKLYQMTVFSDLVAESGLSLKVYDASSGEIHDIVETLDFASDTELGSLPSPITYHAGFKQCVLNLVEGYNWISFNVLPDDASAGSVLSGFSAQDNDVIKSVQGSSTFYGGTWYPSDYQINPDYMYMLKKGRTGAEQVIVEGQSVDSSDPVSLVAGWNWAGYKLGNASAIGTALQNLTALNNDIVKSPAGSTTFYGGAWYPSDYMMTPGVGYMFKLASSQSFAYSETGAAIASVAMAAKVASSSESPGWTLPSGKPYSMIVYATVTVGSSPIEAEGSQLAVFENDQVAGVANIMTGPIGKLYQVTVFSDQTFVSDMMLKVYDAVSGDVYEVTETVDFVADTEAGSIVSPIAFTTVFLQPPSWQLNPASTGHLGGATNGLFYVTQTQGDPANWTASLSAQAQGWVHLTGETNGVGGGEVRYSIDWNDTGAQRQGAIWVENAPFMITQEPALSTTDALISNKMITVLFNDGADTNMTVLRSDGVAVSMDSEGGEYGVNDAGSYTYERIDGTNALLTIDVEAANAEEPDVYRTVELQFASSSNGMAICAGYDATDLPTWIETNAFTLADVSVEAPQSLSGKAVRLEMSDGGVSVAFRADGSYLYVNDDEESGSGTYDYAVKASIPYAADLTAAEDGEESAFDLTLMTATTGVMVETDPDNDDAVVDAGIFMLSDGGLYALTVENGTQDGPGIYTAGTEVEISADAPARYYRFAGWTGDTQAVADVSATNTTVTMPQADAIVTATYELIPPVWSLSPPNAAPDGVAQDGSFTVTQGVESMPTNWTAEVISGGGWLSLAGAAAGVGGGTVDYSVTANDTGVSRQGEIRAAGNVFTVVQAPALAPPPASVGTQMIKMLEENGDQSMTVLRSDGFSVTVELYDDECEFDDAGSYTYERIDGTNALLTIQLEIASGEVVSDNPYKTYAMEFTTATNGTAVCTWYSDSSPGWVETNAFTLADVSATAPQSLAGKAVRLGWEEDEGEVYVAFRADGTYQYVAEDEDAGAGTYTYAVNETNSYAASMTTVEEEETETFDLTMITATNGVIIEYDPANDNAVVDASVFALSDGGLYELTVENGTYDGPGIYTAGTDVGIFADAPAQYYRFAGWTGDTQAVADVSATNTAVTMPQADVSVTATYELIPPVWSLSSSNIVLTGSAQTDSFEVTQSPDSLPANWTAEVAFGSNWLSLVSGTSGTGDGTVTFAVTDNDSGRTREGDILAANEIFTVRQASLPPEAPHSPDPADGEPGVDRYVTLGWTGCRQALQYEVFFGTNAANLRYAARLASTNYQTGTRPAGETAFWQVVASNEAGAVTGALWRFTTDASQTTDESLNTDGQGLDWSGAGESAWFSQTNVTHDGTNAMQSGAVADGQESVMQVALEGPGTLSFWSRVSSDPSDGLTFSLNGTALTNWSGAADWSQTLVDVTDGSQTAQWAYVKDASGDAGEDAAWVDEVSWQGENKVVFPVSFPGTWIAAYVWDDTDQEWIELGYQYSPTEIEFKNMRLGRWYWLCVMEYSAGSKQWNLAHGSWFQRFEGY